MKGEFLKNELKNLGFGLTELSNLLNMSKQNMANRLKTQDIGVGFLRKVSVAVNKSIYYFLEKEESLMPAYDRRQQKRIHSNSVDDRLKKLEDDILKLKQKNINPSAVK